MISVIIPTYQHASSLPECLDAVLAQTFKDIEVIVVDDGSTDDTQEVLRRYRDRVHVVRQENQGSNFARMRGFHESTGDQLVFCDADVIMRPDMLQKLHNTLEKHSEASLAYSAFQFGWKTFRGLPFSAKRLRSFNYIHTTSLVRREHFPGFDLAIKRLQDWDVWLTMAGKGYTGVLVPEVLFQVRVDGESRIGSAWLPSWMYKVPWGRLGWKPQRIKKYEAAKHILKQKHGL